MNPTSKRLSSLLLALLLVLNLGAALAQEARQSEEEQGFFGDLWHYVERLPLAMENDEEAYGKRIKFIKDIYADKYRSFAEEDEEQGAWQTIVKIGEMPAQILLDRVRGNSFQGSLWDKTKEAGSFLAAGARAAGAAITDAWDDVVAPLGF